MWLDKFNCLLWPQPVFISVNGTTLGGDSSGVNNSIFAEQIIYHQRIRQTKGTSGPVRYW